MEFRLNIITIYVEGARGDAPCHISDQFITTDYWKEALYDEIRHELFMYPDFDKIYYGNHSITCEDARQCKNYDELADKFDIARAMKMDRVVHEFTVFSSKDPAYKRHIRIQRA